MILTSLQTLAMIAAVAAGAILTRATPFLLFSERKRPSPFLLYLGRVLPPAMMGLLVVFCFKNTPLLTPPHGLPELAATGFLIALHLWKRSVFLSIGAGTALYMLLAQSGFFV